jgi:hypothetical protein
MNGNTKYESLLDDIIKPHLFILDTKNQNNMKTKTIMAVCLLSLGLIFSACKKETGPQGPQGEQGQQGKTGNSNVITQTYTLVSASWALGCSGSCWYYTWNVLPYSDMTNGAVQVYAQSGTEWVSMPFTVQDIEFYYTYSSSSISFRVRSASGNTSVSNPGDNVFKVVYIPPAMVKKGVNLKNYSEVKKAYNL